MDNTETPDINSFIQSVPEVQKLRSDNHDYKLQQDDVFQGIRRELEKRLDRPDDEKEEWLLQLAELDLTDEHADDNEINTLASLLTNYVVDYPWIYDHSTVIQLGNGSEPVSSTIEKIKHSDYTLGLAGMFPHIRESASNENDQSTPTPSNNAERKGEFISQFRDHVTISDNDTRKCATINFLLRSEEYSERVLKNLLSHIEKDGHIKIPYLRLNPAWNGSLEDDKYIVMAAIKLDTIRDLITTCYRLTESTLLRSIPFVLGALGGLLLGARIWSELNSRDSLSQVMEALRRVFDDIGVKIPIENEQEELSIDKIRSMIALATQFLCLVLQSYVRGSMTPFHFDFLVCRVSDFVLQGDHALPDLPSIYASSQKLSCLGDMLRQEVLVFGLREPFQERIDIVATPSQLVDMWGPGELIVKKANPSNESGDSSIVGIKIWGGVILSTGKSIQGIQMWHWLPQRHIDIDRLNLSTYTETGLNTPIRIGATSLVEVNPIGPARLNKGCPRTGDCTTQFETTFSSSLKVIGTKDSRIATQSIQAGLQAGQFVNIIANSTLIRKPGRTAKEQILNATGLFEVRLADFDRIWGLFLSPCTGIMCRARLRELVAFFCLRCSPKQIPPSPIAAREESMHEFAKAMCGEASLNDWFESLIPDDKSDDFSFREGLQHRIISLFNGVLDMIKETGILENGDLAVAWLSSGNALNTLTLSARQHPWIKVLSDSSLTATFACISPHCFQTMDCSCQNDEWRLPSEFRLSTKIDMFGQYLQPESPRRYALRIQKSYPINSSTLNILAKINGVIVRADTDPCYYITIKKSVLPLDLIRYTRYLPFLRENNSPNAVNVVISSGSKYVHHLEELRQQGKLKIQQ
ncbi:hypothetical protein Asppvi_009052 [Aspergillus pseudoviridinutans]|uniref:Uncharacterized protein n=1 Tax=Aspergillus pseudoviridinutans TaxID=1517512 RepID=A0A9P3BF94_9EURO|nr:uncharacterized protein Asppvi_009052 [Aspergillus pseudoviridinutans]GIJ90102.1 hypothetical protein Asppvi_009052 [Aspergillus pseudoviridinutans]